MERARPGDTVKVNYTGRFDDGTVFDSSENREPLTFKVGEGQVIEGFDKAIDGMLPGESKTVKIPADQAYGLHDDDLMMVVDRAEFPEDIEPQVGDQLQLLQPDGRAAIVTVTDANDKTVTLDGNHPLAGKDLTFDVQLVEIAPIIIRG